MTIRSLEAVFEDGVFRPIGREPVTLADGEHVLLTIETELPTGDPLESLMKVFDGMTEEQIRQVEEIALDRSNFMRPSASG